MLPTVVTETSSPYADFSATNLVIALVVIGTVWAILVPIRRSISRRRLERWAREEGPHGAGQDDKPTTDDTGAR